MRRGRVDEPGIQVCGADAASALEPPTVSASAVILACTTGQVMRQAFDVCAVTPRPAQKPDMVSYNAFVGSCVKGLELRRAYVVCAGMLCQALKQDSVNYNAYTSASSYLGVRPGGTRPVPRGRTPGRGGDTPQPAAPPRGAQ